MLPWFLPHLQLWPEFPHTSHQMASRCFASVSVAVLICIPATWQFFFYAG